MALGVTAASTNLRVEANLNAPLANTTTLYQGDLVTQEKSAMGTDGLAWGYYRCTYSSPNKPGNRVGATGWSQSKWFGNI